MLILNQNEVKQLINMSEAIDVNEKAYLSYCRGKASSPKRFNMPLDGPEEFALFMPGFISDLEGLGVKVVTAFPQNVKKGLPATQAAIMLFDTKNGVPIAFMDGTYITALRTGAGTGVATKYLAVKDARSVAIIGTGGMAAHQLEAVCAVRDIEKVYVYNRTTERGKVFIEDMQKTLSCSLAYELASSPEEAVQDADIIVTSTASPTPVVKYEWLKKGAHVNGVGAFNSKMQEVDEELVLKAERKVVDSIPGATVAGDLAIPLNNKKIVEADLIEIGDFIDQGLTRGSKDGVTYFKSVGLSAQDIACAVQVLNNAKKQGLGVEVAL